MTKEGLIIELIELSKTKKDLMSILLDLTKDQNKLLHRDDEDFDDISVIIDEKQEIMKKIDAIDGDFLVKFNAMKKALGINSLEDIQAEPVQGFRELKQEIQDIIKLMEELKLLDEANTQNAKANLDKVKEQLKVINVGKKATNSYSSSKYQQSHSILIDKKK